MNGRMYDPVLGRMLSPDNYVQNASSTQNFNRYSYCLNNPLKYTDPTGNDYSPDWLLQYMEEASKEWFREQDKLYIGKFYHTSWSYGRQEIPGYGIQTKTNLYAIDTDWYNVDDDGTRIYTNTSTKYELRSEQELAWVGNGQDGETEPPIAGNAQGNGGNLDPSTVGQNYLGTNYAGPNNPRSYNGEENYSVVPKNLSDYPAIGHDRNYQRLRISGALGVFTDTRAIGADWQFVAEELAISSISGVDFMTRFNASVFGIGMGLGVLPKTLFQLCSPFGVMGIQSWYNFSNQGVTNAPSNPYH